MGGLKYKLRSVSSGCYRPFISWHKIAPSGGEPPTEAHFKNKKIKKKETNGGCQMVATKWQAYLFAPYVAHYLRKCATFSFCERCKRFASKLLRARNERVAMYGGWERNLPRLCRCCPFVERQPFARPATKPGCWLHLHN